MNLSETRLVPVSVMVIFGFCVLVSFIGTVFLLGYTSFAANYLFDGYFDLLNSNKTEIIHGVISSLKQDLEASKDEIAELKQQLESTVDRCVMKMLETAQYDPLAVDISFLGNRISLNVTGSNGWDSSHIVIFNFDAVESYKVKVISDLPNNLIRAGWTSHATVENDNWSHHGYGGWLKAVGHYSWNGYLYFNNKDESQTPKNKAWTKKGNSIVVSKTATNFQWKVEEDTISHKISKFGISQDSPIYPAITAHYTNTRYEISDIMCKS